MDSALFSKCGCRNGLLGLIVLCVVGVVPIGLIGLTHADDEFRLRLFRRSKDSGLIEIGNKDSDLIEIEGMTIRRLDGKTFERTSVLNKTTYYAALSAKGDFAANVTILMDAVGSKCTSLDDYLVASRSQAKLIGMQYDVMEQTATTAIMSANVGALHMYQKVIRDDVRCRFVVVTGAYKDESDRQEIRSCVDSARLVRREVSEDDERYVGAFKNGKRKAKDFSLSSLSHSINPEDSAEDAIKGALANVRSRYRSTLDYYGLTEVHYENNRTVCVLCLSRGNAMPDGQITYHKEVDLLEWPSFVPKGLAQQLLQDRMLIEQYTKTVGK